MPRLGPFPPRSPGAFGCPRDRFREDGPMNRPLLFAVALFAVGCQEQDVHVYRVAKEAPDSSAGLAALMAPDSMEGSMPAAAPPAEAASAPELSWKAPPSWKAAPASGMRIASFSYQGADISVIAIPGEAGGELANVNRWRGQLGLSPLTDGEMSSHSTQVKR